MNIQNTMDQPSFASIDWYLPTNHLNLAYMMAAGLVLPESGFKNKYYNDPLSLFPENILCFAEKIPGKALTMSVQEASHLIPCVIKINLQSLKGRVHTINAQGEIQSIADFSQEKIHNPAAVLLPCPIPASWIETVYFPSKKELAAFKEDIQDFSNIDPGNFSIRTNKSLFNIKKDKKKSDYGSIFGTHDPFPWKNAQEHMAGISTRAACNIAGACGGVIGLLYAMADHGPVQAAAFHGAMEEKNLLPGHPSDISFIYPFWSWTPQYNFRLYNTIFWGMVKAIAETSRPETAKETVLGYLNQLIETKQEICVNEKAKLSLQSLVQDLLSVNQARSDLTLSQLLEKHPKPFSRAVILFFLRETSQQLLDFENENFDASSRVGAAILFGARDGWIGLPAHLKESSQLRCAVFFRMAILARTDNLVNLGTAPASPVLWRDMFSIDQSTQWTSKLEKAAVLLAKHQKWDCIHTHVYLGQGEYTLKASRSGLELVLKGVEKRITHTIDHNIFIEYFNNALTQKKFSYQIQEKIQKLLGINP